MVSNANSLSELMPFLLLGFVRSRLLGSCQRIQDGSVRRPDFIIGFDKFPTHHPCLVDHIGSRMRQARAVGVEQSVAVDHLMFLVLQQREFDLPYIVLL